MQAFPRKTDVKLVVVRWYPTKKTQYELFHEGVKPARGKTIRGKQNDNAWKHHLIDIGVFRQPQVAPMAWRRSAANRKKRMAMNIALLWMVAKSFIMVYHGLWWFIPWFLPFPVFHRNPNNQMQVVRGTCPSDWVQELKAHRAPDLRGSADSTAWNRGTEEMRFFQGFFHKISAMKQQLEAV